MKAIVFEMLLMFGVSASAFAGEGSNSNQAKTSGEKPMVPAPSTAK